LPERGRMDVAQLEAFDRIVRYMSFSRAAEELEISQPTISARIQTLEAEIGTPLFVRGGRYLALTEQGERFRPYAQRALLVLREGKEAARLAASGKSGRLTIGAIESLTGGFLATAVARFHQAYPEVEVFIRAEHTDQIILMLNDGVVKLGLVTWPFYDQDLVPLLRFREPLVLVVPPHHPLSGGQSATLEQVALLGQPFLQVRWGPVARPLFNRMAGYAGTRVEVPIDTARQLVLQGIGATFLTHTLVKEDLAAGRLMQINVSDAPETYRESALVHLRRTELSVATLKFVEELGEVFEGIKT
jgi:DNA-binding transcriptional LysR family regulator